MIRDTGKSVSSLYVYWQTGIKTCQLSEPLKNCRVLGRENIQKVKANKTIVRPKAKGQRLAIADGSATRNRSSQYQTA
jgi:hypothetical protein